MRARTVYLMCSIHLIIIIMGYCYFDRIVVYRTGMYWWMAETASVGLGKMDYAGTMCVCVWCNKFIRGSC